MANIYKLDILSPEGNIFSGDVTLATFPTASGLITILANHAALITKLVSGEIEIEHNGERKFITITGGFLEVSDNLVSVIADFAIRSEDIDDEKIAAAKKYAEEQKAKKSRVSSEIAERELQKAILSMNIMEHNKLKRKKGAKF
ncbi:MAG: ATP synthase F1 subunit epsilon [Elusimicrobia bacterium]|nr:ATP synthase F1 subunit epsilon [Elusimicrobiota bacterium]